MADKEAKEFERRVKQSWEASVPDSAIYRLVDTMGGYKGVNNVSDFIAYKYPIQFYLEAKKHTGPRFPFSAFPQFDRMKEYYGITGLKEGVVLWFKDYRRVIWIPLETFLRLENEGHKSFNIKLLDNHEYEWLDLKPEFKVKYPSIDFKNLVSYYKGE